MDSENEQDAQQPPSASSDEISFDQFAHELRSQRPHDGIALAAAVRAHLGLSPHYTSGTMIKRATLTTALHDLVGEA